MPTYDYECKKCGAKMEVFQSIKARPLAKSHCPTCAAVRPVRRLIGTGGAVLFKGSGFYQTDYRSAGYKEKAKSESDAAKPAAASTDTKSDSAKPAASKAPDTSSKPSKKSGGSSKKSSSGE